MMDSVEIKTANLGFLTMRIQRKRPQMILTMTNNRCKWIQTRSNVTAYMHTGIA